MLKLQQSLRAATKLQLFIRQELKPISGRIRNSQNNSQDKNFSGDTKTASDWFLIIFKRVVFRSD